MVGDGYMQLRHCEYAKDADIDGLEADAGPIYCNPKTSDVASEVKLQDIIELELSLRSGSFLKSKQTMHPATQT